MPPNLLRWTSFTGFDSNSLLTLRIFCDSRVCRSQKVFPGRDSTLAGRDDETLLLGQDALLRPRCLSFLHSHGEETVTRPRLTFPGFCFVFITGRIIQKQKPKQSGPCAEIKSVSVSDCRASPAA